MQDIIMETIHQKPKTDSLVEKKAHSLPLPVSIRIKNLNVFIQDQHILKDIDLALPEKSIICIIGPSGCGKSTSLKRSTGCTMKPRGKITGSVFVDGMTYMAPI
jgi:phosphate transport system ATP-binding protein